MTTVSAILPGPPPCRVCGSEHHGALQINDYTFACAASPSTLVLTGPFHVEMTNDADYRVTPKRHG